MRQPIHKKLLSYLYDIPIESLSSEYNESLDLVLSHGRYQLLTQGAIYSYEDKYDNFKKSFEQLNISKRSIEDVLILGLGMGSIPIILERCFGQIYHYTGVEIDDAVIHLLSKYILDDLQSTIEIVETDAHIYMLQNQTKYDMICIDVFIDDQIPSIFKTRQFLESIQSALNKNGIILFNWLAVNQIDTVLIEQYMKQVFHKVFPEGYNIPLASNQMLIGIG